MVFSEHCALAPRASLRSTLAMFIGIFSEAHVLGKYENLIINAVFDGYTNVCEANISLFRRKNITFAKAKISLADRRITLADRRISLFAKANTYWE